MVADESNKINKQTNQQIANQETTSGAKDQSQSKYFYFDLADKSHEKIVSKDEKKASEDPMDPLADFTKIEY